MLHPDVFEADDLRKEQFFDATTFAREAGCVLPVAISRRVWEQCIAWNEDTPWDKAEDEVGNSELAQAMALMTLTSLAEQNALAEAGDVFEFDFRGVPRRGVTRAPVALVLRRWQSATQGDYLTVMLKAET